VLDPYAYPGPPVVQTVAWRLYQQGKVQARGAFRITHRLENTGQVILAGHRRVRERVHRQGARDPLEGRPALLHNRERPKPQPHREPRLALSDWRGGDGLRPGSVPRHGVP